MTDNSKSQSADTTESERQWIEACSTALVDTIRISSSMLAKLPAHMLLTHPLSKALADILHSSMSALTQGIVVSPTSSNDTETMDASLGPSPATDARTDPLIGPDSIRLTQDLSKAPFLVGNFSSWEPVVDFPTASDKK